MTTWLLDASVLLASEDADDSHHRAAVQVLTIGDPLATLDLAFYEVTNVALRAWHDSAAAARLQARVSAISEDAGLVRVDAELVSAATAIAEQHRISAYDAAYVAAARRLDAVLLSCDERDLISRGLAVPPGDAVQADEA